MRLSELELSNQYASLGEPFGQFIQPKPFEHPHLVHINPAGAALLGLNPGRDSAQTWAEYGCGARLFRGSRPFAMKYAGHQFGVYNPELGDGRGLLLGEARGVHGERWDLHLKGAGKTPYSRFGDGRAVLRSTIREYLCSEAMHALGIASTRALCIIGSDEPVVREKIESGAMLIRLARTHIRFGHFEHFFYTGQHEALEQLVHFTCAEQLPQTADLPVAEKAAAILEMAMQRSARLVAQWQAAGFAHGVLNTDNMSIIGDTFDYGPYGFLDDYEPGFICNHSDHTGRYAFERQPGVVLWNLNALGHALSGLLTRETIVETLQRFEPLLVQHYSSLMRARLGFEQPGANDDRLCAQLLKLLEDASADYPAFFRRLSRYSPGEGAPAFSDLFGADHQAPLADWLQRYDTRLKAESRPAAERQQAMLRTNPKFILRNFLAQRVIDAAEGGDFAPLDRFMSLLQAPFDEHPGNNDWAALPGTAQKHLPISCSS